MSLVDLGTELEEWKSSENSRRLEFGKKYEKRVDQISVLEGFYKNQIIALRYLKENKDNLTYEERQELQDLIDHIYYLVDQNRDHLSYCINNWVENEE